MNACDLSNLVMVIKHLYDHKITIKTLDLMIKLKLFLSYNDKKIYLATKIKHLSHD